MGVTIRIGREHRSDPAAPQLPAHLGEGNDHRLSHWGLRLLVGSVGAPFEDLHESTVVPLTAERLTATRDAITRWQFRSGSSLCSDNRRLLQWAAWWMERELSACQAPAIVVL